MSSAIVQVFQDQEVRIVDIDGAIWWVAADVCKAIEVSNPTQALNRLDDDEKSTLCLSEGIGSGNPNVNIINQYGLFSLILSSRKPSAKAFKRWVTHEVLPSIAAKGSYSIPNPEPAQKALPPETSLEKWGELIRDLGLTKSPIVMSAFEQRLSEELTGKTLPGDVDAPILLTVRANQLGCPHSIIGTGSLLGKYIRAKGFEPLGKSQHGKYSVNAYRASADLDAAILEFCAPEVE